MRLVRILACLLPALVAAAAGRADDGRYAAALRELCDSLVAAQITDPASPDCGALVCPSTNPQEHPLHSRAAEAVYPLAFMWRRTHDVRYRDTAILLARWLLTKQQTSGAWGENWPNYDGWAGTTSDQLISLAAAWPLLQDGLTAADQAAWIRSMRRAAEYIVRSFPVGNINYQPTGAVALQLAAAAVPAAPATWRAKADALIALTVGSVNADGLLTGEGKGVDLGYNLAQSIGYLALYGRLTGDEPLRDRATALLRVHLLFVYPNGSVDNSWGTRSFKWTYESGTKTAPGVYFSFALLADKDPAFGPAGDLCLDYLTGESLGHGLVTYGPHAGRHASTNPPCLYGTFARAQSLALALAYAPPAAPGRGAVPAQTAGWFHFFPTVRVAVVRTAKIMATVSAYGETGQYARELVSRGGSLTNLWLEGFGRRGQAQTSSVTRYRREEGAHMPVEGDLRPLTPRVECTVDGTYYANLFETGGTMTVTQEPDHVAVKTAGQLRSATGAPSGINYVITHRFYADHLTKEYALTSPVARTIRIVEPFVDDPGTVATAVTPRRMRIQPAGSPPWVVEIAAGAPELALGPGPDREKYWCPFPAVDCLPLELDLPVTPGATIAVELSLHPG